MLKCTQILCEVTAEPNTHVLFSLFPCPHYKAEPILNSLLKHLCTAPKPLTGITDQKIQIKKF